MLHAEKVRMDAKTLFLKLFRCFYVSLEVSFVSFALFLTNLGVFKVSGYLKMDHPAEQFLGKIENIWISH